MGDSKIMWGRSTGMLVRRVHLLHRTMTKELLDELASLRLSLNQAITVCYLHDHADGPIYQKDIEREQGLTNPTVTAMVKSMVANDVVYRVRDKSDGRYWQLKLTPHGMDLYEPARDILLAINDRYESRLDADELVTFYRIVSKLLQDDETEEEREAREG